MPEDKDRDITVFFGGKYYYLAEAEWKKASTEMAAPPAAARAVVDSGTDVKYAPGVMGIGGYSTVLNLEKVLTPTKK